MRAVDGHHSVVYGKLFVVPVIDTVELITHMVLAGFEPYRALSLRLIAVGTTSTYSKAQSASLLIHLNVAVR